MGADGLVITPHAAGFVTEGDGGGGVGAGEDENRFSERRCRKGGLVWARGRKNSDLLCFGALCSC